MDHTFERFLIRIRQFLKEARGGKLSKEDEEYVKVLTDTKKHLENLQETGECDQTATLKNVCQAVLYGGYIIVKNNYTVFKQKVNQVREAESKSMPEILQPKIKEIKGYLAKLCELIENMDNLAKKISKMVADILGRDTPKPTVKEGIAVKVLNIDFATAVKKTTDYFNQADRVLKMFESDVVSYKKNQKNKHCIYGGLALLATFATAGLVSTVAGVAEATAAAAAAGGGSGVLALDYFIYSNQCEKVNIECERLNRELRELRRKEAENDLTFQGEMEKTNLFW